MTMPTVKLELLLYPDKRLREISRSVDDKVDRGVRQLVDAMVDIVFAKRAAGLSAIQVGAPLRIFVLDGDIVQKGLPPLTFINPEIVELSDEKQTSDEGCLSFPDIFVPLQRSMHVKVKAWNAEGKPFEMRASRLGARAIQHEYDHLSGKLFIDHLGPIRRDIIKRKMAAAAKERAVKLEQLRKLAARKN
jgi:peptide deformylase